MEYTGLIIKYPVNRALTDAERDRHLKQKIHLDVDPVSQLSVINANASYLELVDKFYAWKGLLTTFAVAAIALFASGLAFVMIDELFVHQASAEQPLWFLMFVCALFGAAIAGMIWLARKEAFAFTHYPIRLNRVTRDVHVFRLDGSVLTASWDDIFFCLASLPQGAWEIQGHILDQSRQTVVETFALSVWGAGKSDAQQLMRFWEFARRYMEESPDGVLGQDLVLLPISRQKESVGFSFRRMQAEAGGNPAIAFLLGCIALLLLPGRWLAMRTCKIPKWPDEIEANCKVPDNDPFAIGMPHAAPPP